MSNATSFEDFKKAQQVIVDAIDKSARINLATMEKLLEMNKERFGQMGEVSSPADLFSRQSTAFKDYAEQINHHMEELAAVGTESREQLTELGQDFARNVDFSGLFNFGQEPAKPKGRSSSKAA